MGADIAPQIITATATLGAAAMGFVASEVRARKSRFQDARLNATADFLSCSTQARNVMLFARPSLGSRILDIAELLAADDPKLDEIGRQLSDRCAALNDAFMRTTLLCPSLEEPARPVIDSVGDLRLTYHDQAAFDAAYDALSSANVDFKAAARKVI